MNSVFFIRLIRMLALVACQVLVLNQVHLLGYITPLLLGYMMVCFHRGTSRVVTLLWGFTIGLIFDIFNNTAGMASAACTFVAMIQQPLLNMFAPRDAAEDFVPTFNSLGFWSYLSYTLILMFVLHAVFYLLDAFTLSDWQMTLYAIVGGTLLSCLITFFVELLVRTRKVQ
ncbi:MAG: rod shape-determining protein MreD [Prevotellaceae bacterium]|nr:rod shape-determining protein MreD [Candidatus Minthosoma caballi]